MDSRVVQVIDFTWENSDLVAHGVVERAGFEARWNARRAGVGGWEISIDRASLDLGDDALLDLFLEEGDLGPDIHRELSRMGAMARRV